MAALLIVQLVVVEHPSVDATSLSPAFLSNCSAQEGIRAAIAQLIEHVRNGSEDAKEDAAWVLYTMPRLIYTPATSTAASLPSPR